MQLSCRGHRYTVNLTLTESLVRPETIRTEQG
jgi:hypothetical protein